MGNRAKTFFLLTLMTVVIMALGQVIGGSRGITAAFFMALGLNFFVYWFSADIVLFKTKARVIGPGEAPELHNLVEHLAHRAGLPTPKIAIVDENSPNAFATGRSPSKAVVAVTSGLLKILNREELAGVLSHELAHVKNRDILLGSVVAVLAGVIMLLARMAGFSSLFFRSRARGNQFGGIILAIVAPLAALLIQAAISRSREYMADDGGADIACSSLGLASALAKLQLSQTRSPMSIESPETSTLFIVNPLSSRRLSQLFASHPPIEERIDRLRGQRP